MKFAENLSRLFEQKGCTQREMAAQTGLDRSRISLWLNGHATPHPRTQVKIANFFGVSVEDLMNPGHGPSIVRQDDIRSLAMIESHPSKSVKVGDGNRTSARAKFSETKGRQAHQLAYEIKRRDAKIRLREEKIENMKAELTRQKAMVAVMAKELASLQRKRVGEILKQVEEVVALTFSE